jgi:hypothetical protein
MSSVNAIKRTLERLGFSESVVTYLIGTCGVDSLGEIAYLDANKDGDEVIKGVTSPGGTVTTGGVTSRFTSHSNWIPVSIRAVANLKLYVYYLKHMERVQRQPVPNAINLVLLRSYRYQKNSAMKKASRRQRKNLKSMTKIGQGPWRRSKSTLPPNMVSLDQHCIMLFALRLQSNLKLKILLRIMKLLIKK